MNKKQEEMLQRWAREEFYRLPEKTGRPRSIKSLYEHFKMKSKEEGREAVPTLHKNHLSTWRNKYGWDEWVAQREFEESEWDSKKYRRKRERALDQMTLLSDDAISELGRLINDKMTPPAIKVKAIDLVLSRVIVQREQEAAHQGTRELPSLPSKDATYEEKLTWLDDWSKIQ